MSVPQHNAQQMYKQNEGSGERMQSMSVSERRFIPKAARAEDGSGQNKATRHSITEHMKGVADGKRERDCVRNEKEREAQALRVFSRSGNLVDGYLNVAELDLQLDWYLQQYPNSGIPKAKSGRGNREAKFGLLKDVVAQYGNQDV
ncbi:hypothetical protein EV360DRAFT_74767 [Lentinula raphanica]|nr:hypothetical protein EV360DRAFT_74767 [Lentinula raphanica]